MKYKLKNGISIMGILNVTPDSFYDGGKYINIDATMNRVNEMIKEGVDIIDIGAESTRPGSKPVSFKEELLRLMPVVKKIREKSDIPISIDTTKSEIIRELLNYNIQFINDVSAGSDQSMMMLAKDNNLYISLMHMQKNPETMQEHPAYDNVVDEIHFFLKKKYQKCNDYDIDPSKIIIDPGFGFGKTVQHNFMILDNLSKFASITNNVLVGISRKSMIGASTSREPSDRLYGSLSAEVVSVINKAKIIRVHDILETSIMVKTLEAIR